jgi:ABC-type Fe3+/spermidine/putrescine transport system ATPase subunit
MTFIYVTHSLESALLMSDKLFVLQDGDIIQTGSPEEIYRRPNTKFIAEFMGDANVFELDGAEPKDGGYEVKSSRFAQTTTAPYHHDDEPKHLVVRYDDSIVDTELTADIGLEVLVENVLVRGNTVLVECGLPESDGEYVAEMPVEAFRGTEIEKGDTVYLQWDSARSILVPE